jgi:CRP-like cAMP-binding protein
MKHLKYKFVKKGEILFYQGDIPQNFYIIISGKLGIFINIKNQK